MAASLCAPATSFETPRQEARHPQDEGYTVSQTLSGSMPLPVADAAGSAWPDLDARIECLRVERVGVAACLTGGRRLAHPRTVPLHGMNAPNFDHAIRTAARPPPPLPFRACFPA